MSPSQAGTASPCPHIPPAPLGPLSSTASAQRLQVPPAWGSVSYQALDFISPHPPPQPCPKQPSAPPKAPRSPSHSTGPCFYMRAGGARISQVLRYLLQWWCKVSQGRGCIALAGSAVAAAASPPAVPLAGLHAAGDSGIGLVFGWSHFEVNCPLGAGATLRPWAGWAFPSQGLASSLSTLGVGGLPPGPRWLCAFSPGLFWGQLCSSSLLLPVLPAHGPFGQLFGSILPSLLSKAGQHSGEMSRQLFAEPDPHHPFLGHARGTPPPAPLDRGIGLNAPMQHRDAGCAPKCSLDKGSSRAGSKTLSQLCQAAYSPPKGTAPPSLTRSEVQV